MPEKHRSIQGFGNLPITTGDEQPRWTKQFRSENRAYLLREDWFFGEFPRLTFKERSQNGFRHLWTIPSQQKAGPTDAFIANDGQSIVLCNAWYSGGKVILLLGHDGRTRRAYAREDVLSKDEIEKVWQYNSDSMVGIHSPGIIWADMFFLRPSNAQFGFFTQHGGVLRLFELPSGATIALSPALADEVKVEQINIIRQRLPRAGSDERYSLAYHLRAIRDRRAVPLLIPLLDDRSFGKAYVAQSSSVPDGTYKWYGVQIAAGIALAAILGKEAIPLFKRKMVGANAEMKRLWKSLIEDAITGK